MNEELWLQWSIWVLIVSQYGIYLYHAVLDALLPPVLQFAIWSIFVVSLLNKTHHWGLLAVSQQILIGSEFGEQDAKP